jgi:hypothetical protein
MHSVILTMHSAIPTMHSAIPAMHSVIPTMHSAIPAMHSAIPTMHSVIPTMHSVILTMHSAIPTMHIVAHISKSWALKASCLGTGFVTKLLANHGLCRPTPVKAGRSHTVPFPLARALGQNWLLTMSHERCHPTAAPLKARLSHTIPLATGCGAKLGANHEFRHPLSSPAAPTEGCTKAAY